MVTTVAIVLSAPLENIQWPQHSPWLADPWIGRCAIWDEIAHLPIQGHHHLIRKVYENKSFEPNLIAPSVYIMMELCCFSLDQWEIRIHLLWGKSFNIPLHCDPHLNDLLPLTIPGVFVWCITHSWSRMIRLAPLRRIILWWFPFESIWFLFGW